MKRPTTPDDSFAKARSRFVPRLMALFAVYALGVYAPDLIAAGRTFLESIEPSPEPPAVPTVPLTISPPPVLVEPVFDAARGVWVLDQRLSTNYEAIQIGLRHRVGAIAQTFRAPANGTAIQLIELDLYHAEKGMRVSVFELDDVMPGGGRRIFTRVLPRYVAGVNEDPQIVILPQAPLDPDRTYALVLRPSTGDAGVSFLAEDDVYLDGAAWMQDRGGRWRSLVGELAFRLEFLAVG